MTKKYILRSILALGSILMGTASLQAQHPIVIEIEEIMLLADDQAPDQESNIEKWFQVTDSEGNLIVELHDGQNSLDYRVCEENCSDLVVAKKEEDYYADNRTLLGREILLKENKSGNFGTILRIFKRKDMQIGRALGNSTWSREEVVPLEVQVNSEGTRVYLSIYPLD
ncbi:MAG: hypothetical protein KDD52_03245 [Bdellovibrionales bacterium]|nr:hypothetical protein [Bdellovibrionales bacterium]